MKLLTWTYLLTKRLYKKPTFLAILLIISLLVWGYGALARQEAGILTVSLAMEDRTDPMAQKITAQLAESSQLIRFVLCSSPEEAETMVAYGKAESAWIFEADLENRIYSFIADPIKSNAFIRVIEREENIALLLAREKLTGTVFTCTSAEFYLHYVRQNLPQLKDVPEETLLQHYENMGLQDSLFQFAFSGSVSLENSQNYLLSPIRGLLSVVVCLCGLAGTLYYTDDTRRGTFSWVPRKKEALAEFGCQIVSVSNVSVIVLVALYATGLAGNLFRELAALLPYILCVSLFAMTVRRLLRNIRLLGTFTPFLVVVMLAVCPVFLDFEFLRPFQLMLPPTYYIHGAYNAKYLLYMALYSAGAGFLCLALDKLFAK